MIPKVKASKQYQKLKPKYRNSMKLKFSEKLKLYLNIIANLFSIFNIFWNYYLL